MHTRSCLIVYSAVAVHKPVKTRIIQADLLMQSCANIREMFCMILIVSRACVRASIHRR
jgi:hypothetical protein